MDLYRHFMNPRELTVGRPPKDRGCKRCGKIGHWIKDCPIKANGESNGEFSCDYNRFEVCYLIRRDEMSTLFISAFNENPKEK